MRKRTRGVPPVGKVLRFATKIFAVIVAIQVGLLVALTLLAGKKRKKQPKTFLHREFPSVDIGDSDVQLFSYGQDLFAAMLKAIDDAKETIYLETFIWKNDSVGQDFKDHLTRKAREGIDVYVIFDAFGNLVVPRAFKEFRPEIKVLEYQPVHRLRHIIDPRRYALDHRKILTVDGRVGFLGGYNIGSLYATMWRDTHVRIEGPATADLTQSFISFWNGHSPPERKITHHYPRVFDPLIVLQDNDAARLAFPIRDVYISAIDRAERQILLTNAYFIPDRSLLSALRDASSRGVDVQILLPWISNHTLPDWLARGLFTTCLESGFRIFAFQSMVHAKTCTVDGQWSTIGTANMDRLSSVGNYELNVEIYSKELANHMQQLFEQDKLNAREITLDQWRQRPLLAKASERLLSPLRVFG